MRAKVVTVVSGQTVVSTKFTVTVLGRAKVSNGFNGLLCSKLLRQHNVGVLNMLRQRTTEAVIVGLNKEICMK